MIVVGAEHPTVTVAVPTLDEEAHIVACLSAIEAQSYDSIVEVLVLDGGSSDSTRDLASGFAGVTIVDNPGRLQAVALNLAIETAKGEVLVRVDAHAVIEPEYVERAVEALVATGAAMVGGQQLPVAASWRGRAIAAAMRSPYGAGPARFRTGGEPGWVDTVYLGAYRVDTARTAGGYLPVAVNEDAEFAIRMADQGGVWFEPSIRASYAPRPSFTKLARQYFRYGVGRAETLRRHPGTVSLRQLAAPALVVALLSPWRRKVAVAYLGGLIVLAGRESREDPTVGPGLVVALPAMHLPWGVGFLVGLLRGSRGAG
jgi:glycosyltransferase involved in cell wall biosynthesis